jgi:hypothetical protein
MVYIYLTVVIMSRTLTITGEQSRSDIKVARGYVITEVPGGERS